MDVAKQESVQSLIQRRGIKKKEFEDFFHSFSAKWINHSGKKYIEQIIDIVKDYAEKVDIAKKYREEWNQQHPPWEQYNNTRTRDGTKFASTVTYRIDDTKIFIRNDAEAQRPMWRGDYPKKGDLSDWIEGDSTTGDSYIHPVPPYWVVNGKKIFKYWFEKSEWLKMWYKADPYIKNALNDDRLNKIKQEAMDDFYIAFEAAANQKWGGKTQK